MSLHVPAHSPTQFKKGKSIRKKNLVLLNLLLLINKCIIFLKTQEEPYLRHRVYRQVLCWALPSSIIFLCALFLIKWVTRKQHGISLVSNSSSNACSFPPLPFIFLIETVSHSSLFAYLLQFVYCCPLHMARLARRARVMLFFCK